MRIVPSTRNAEGRGIVVQGPQAGGARFFGSKKRRHGDRRDNRQKAAEDDDQPRRDIPGDGGRRWGWHCWRSQR